MKNRCYYTPRKDNNRMACEEYIERHGIKNGKRDFDNVIQRQVVAFLMSERGCGRNATGQALGVDHSTITYSEKKIKNYMAVGEAIECIRKEIETILNNNQKNEKKMRPYYLNAKSNYPAMTQEQWERAPFNQPTYEDVEFDCEAYFSVKVKQTISTTNWEIDMRDEYSLIDKNEKSLDETPQSFMKFAIDLIKQRIKEEKNQFKIRELEEKLEFAQGLEFELEDFNAEPLSRPRIEPEEPDYDDEIRERELFGE